jgi:hypothetical protein
MEDKDYLQWIGGFFDADGSIYWMTSGCLVLGFYQSEKTLLDRINKRYNGLFFERAKKNKKTESCIVNRTQFSLSKTGRELYPVLIDLKENCIIKNPQVCLGLEFLTHNGLPGEKHSSERNRIGSTIKRMNNEHFIQEYIEKRPYHKLTIPYIAGFFDGDGSVMIMKNMSRIAKITQRNDPLILKKIHGMYPGSRHKEGEEVIIFEKEEVLRDFLNDILPYLIYKKDQVINFIQFLDSKDDKEKETLRELVSSAKKFDLDHVKYEKTLELLFKDLDDNYSTKDLMLGKKYEEIKNMRTTKSFDNKVMINFETIEDIKPKLIFCESRSEKELWMYYRNKTSSICHSGSIGRNIRILVFDENSEKYIGVMSLGSDFYNLQARDEYIKKIYPDIEILSYINNIANLNCCVPLQPFGYNTNGGKLLVKLAFSQEVLSYWQKKYGEPILAITTLGVNGKSVMYERIPEIKQVGFTKGKCSSIHLPNIVVQKAKLLYLHLGLSNKRHGTIDMLNTLFRQVKINTNYTKHITKRSVYFGWVFRTKLDDKNPAIKELKTIKDITKEWVKRWAIGRIKNLKNSGRYKTKVELLTKDDKIFKDIKIYKLPTSNNILNTGEVDLEKFLPSSCDKIPLLLQRLSDDVIIDILKKKGSYTTEEVSLYLKEKYSKIVPRNDISRLWLGEILPSIYVQSLEEYKKAMMDKTKRVYKKGKTGVWKESIKSGNRKKTISDEVLFEIMRCKKTSKSAEECSKNYSYTSGPKVGKNLNRVAVQKIWSGENLPKTVTHEYEELLNFKRSRTMF